MHRGNAGSHILAVLYSLKKKKKCVSWDLKSCESLDLLKKQHGCQNFPRWQLAAQIRAEKRPGGTAARGRAPAARPEATDLWIQKSETRRRFEICNFRLGCHGAGLKQKREER